MKGIILAAGLGSRLKDRTKNLPKALLPVDNRPLIDYAIDFIQDRVDEIFVIGGYCFHLLKEHLDKRKPTNANLTLIENPDYQEGSILTVEKALAYIDDSFLLMNVDHIYPRQFIDKIMDNISGITGMSDFDRQLVQDDMKIKLNSDNKIIHIDKKLSDYDGGYIGMTSCHGDFAPLYREMVAKAIKEAGRKINVEYILQLFANEGKNPNFLDLSGSTWLEIDDENDLARAEAVLKENPNLLKTR